jgi:hypothetical protein
MTCVYGESLYFPLFFSDCYLLAVGPDARLTAVPRPMCRDIHGGTIADLHAVNMAKKDDIL